MNRFLLFLITCTLAYAPGSPGEPYEGTSVRDLSKGDLEPRNLTLVKEGPDHFVLVEFSTPEIVKGNPMIPTQVRAKIPITDTEYRQCLVDFHEFVCPDRGEHICCLTPGCSTQGLRFGHNQKIDGGYVYSCVGCSENFCLQLEKLTDGSEKTRIALIHNGLRKKVSKDYYESTLVKPIVDYLLLSRESRRNLLPNCFSFIDPASKPYIVYVANNLKREDIGSLFHLIATSKQEVPVLRGKKPGPTLDEMLKGKFKRISENDQEHQEELSELSEQGLYVKKQVQEDAKA